MPITNIPGERQIQYSILVKGIASKVIHTPKKLILKARGEPERTLLFFVDSDYLIEITERLPGRDQALKNSVLAHFPNGTCELQILAP